MGIANNGGQSTELWDQPLTFMASCLIILHGSEKASQSSSAPDYQNRAPSTFGVPRRAGTARMSQTCRDVGIPSNVISVIGQKFVRKIRGSRSWGREREEAFIIIVRVESKYGVREGVRLEMDHLGKQEDENRNLGLGFGKKRGQGQ